MSRSLSVILAVICTLSIAQAQSVAPRQTTVIVSGTVVDDQLRPAAGVAIALERAGSTPLRTVSSADGAYRFTAVHPGEYTIRASAAGFTETSRRLTVGTAAAEIRLPLVLTRIGGPAPAPAPTAPAPAPIMVSAAPPVVDSKKTSTGGTFTKDILQNVPSARDPWQIINGQSSIAAGAGGSGSGVQVGSGRGGRAQGA
jgi:hypothetical protein